MFLPCSPYAALLIEGHLCEEHRRSPSEGAAGLGPPGTQPPRVPAAAGSTAAFAGRISRPVICDTVFALTQKLPHRAPKNPVRSSHAYTWKSNILLLSARQQPDETGSRSFPWIPDFIPKPPPQFSQTPWQVISVLCTFSCPVAYLTTGASLHTGAFYASAGSNLIHLSW